jgi:hypothetical protein
MCMRTTLNLDDDVLFAAQELARRQNKTAGELVSELVRQALLARSAGESDEPPTFGFRPFPARGVVVTNALVEKLREEGEY